MNKITEDVFCDCGEYIATKWLETNEIEIDSEVEHYPINDIRVNAICPYCERKISINGKLISI